MTSAQLELPLAVIPATPAAGALRQVLLGQTAVSYRFRRGRRRSIGLSVGIDGLSVAAPGYTPIHEVEAFIREKSAWIIRKLAEWRNVPKQKVVTWAEGETFPLHGDTVTLAFERGTRQIVLDGGRLRIGIGADSTPAAIRKRTISWLKARARELFAERLSVYAKMLRVPQPTLALSSARTQWGICTEGGHVRLNWRLVHLRLGLVDYVIAHELAHLREMNHSKRFWSVVESLYPNYAAARRELRECDHKLPIL